VFLNKESYSKIPVIPEVKLKRCIDRRNLSTVGMKTPKNGFRDSKVEIDVSGVVSLGLKTEPFVCKLPFIQYFVPFIQDDLLKKAS